MSADLLFLLAFLCFSIVGCCLVILLLPQNNKHKVEQRLLLLANELALNGRAVNSTPIFKSNIHRYLGENFVQLKRTAQQKWQPYNLHLEALLGEYAIKKSAAQIITCVMITLVIFSSFPWYSQITCSLASSMLIAWLYYNYLYKQQIKAYEEQLPSIIDHLARAASTGLSVPQALNSCAQTSQAPVNNELHRLSQQLTLGITLEQALAEAQQRIPVREFSFLAVILILNQQTGGRLSDALNNLSNSLRDRKAMRMKLSSLTSEPRAAANIVSSFPPLTLLGLWLFNPKQWDFLWQDPSGQSILLYAGSSVTFGLLLIHRLARGGVA